jgi:hypothetical protein
VIIFFYAQSSSILSQHSFHHYLRKYLKNCNISPPSSGGSKRTFGPARCPTASPCPSAASCSTASVQSRAISSTKHRGGEIAPKCPSRKPKSRVARWYRYFQTRNPNLDIFGGSCNGRRYILWPFGIFYCHLVDFVVIWYIFPFWYVVPRKIWQPCLGARADICPEWRKVIIFKLHIRNHKS